MAKTAIVVVSCDKYADLWPPFFQIFHQNWPDCPYPVFLGTNHLEYKNDCVTSIMIGQDRSWGENLRLLLDRIDVDRVILFLEDFLLIRSVSTDEVSKMVRVAEEFDVSCLRLRPAPPPSLRLPDLVNLGELQPGEEYRVSTQVAIWEVSVLKQLALPGFSAWDFETLGSLLSDRLPGIFWGVYSPVIDYRHAVERGLWLEEGLEICGRAGVRVDLPARGVVSEEERYASAHELKLTPRGLLHRVLPASVKSALKKRLRRRRLDILLEKSGSG